MIYDCFMFLNEFEILDIRLRELDHVVDFFVLVEAGEAHSGKPKRYFYDEKAEWFRHWGHKIIYVKVPQIPVAYPHLPPAYAREQSHRDCISLGLANLQPHDFVMVGDVDEIPRADAVVKATELTEQYGSVWFNQPLFYYYLNNFVSPVWNGTRMVKGEFLATNPASLCKSKWDLPECVLGDAGWHFSWMGNAERLSYKLDSFMHQEWNHPEVNNVANFQKSLDTGVDFWKRPMDKGELIPTDSLPRCVHDNPSSYAHLLRTKWDD